jgi:hypothetical protein
MAQMSTLFLYTSESCRREGKSILQDNLTVGSFRVPAFDNAN